MRRAAGAGNDQPTCRKQQAEAARPRTFRRVVVRDLRTAHRMIQFLEVLLRISATPEDMT